MEKICTRCNFRTPSIRKICHVCGHSKFQELATTEPVSKQAEIAAPTGNTLLAAFTKATESLKHLFAPSVAEQQNPAPTPAAIELATPPEPTFTDNDLNSMIAWFKSYGVNEPIILKRTKNGSRAA